MKFPATQTLDGPWQLLPVEEFAQGYYPLGDECWLQQDVPAHWQQLPLLERYAGKMIYRKRYALPELNTPPIPPERVARNCMRLNGLF
jgi:beta-mannosidase